MKKSLIITVLTLIALAGEAAAQTQTPAPAQTATPAPAQTQAGHEYSPLVEKTFDYKDWSLPDLKTEKPVELRSLLKGKKLVMVVYFAPWCRNWKFEAPVAAKLYDKYKDQGFQIIGVSEYGSKDDVRTFFGEAGPPYPVVVESEERDVRDKTAHYGYRQLTGDTRNWGSPWNLFLEPDKTNKKGEVVTAKAWVVNGELVEDEVDKFISSKVQASSTVKKDPK